MTIFPRNDIFLRHPVVAGQDHGPLAYFLCIVDADPLSHVQFPIGTLQMFDPKYLQISLTSETEKTDYFLTHRQEDMKGNVSFVVALTFAAHITTTTLSNYFSIMCKGKQSKQGKARRSKFKDRITMRQIDFVRAPPKKFFFTIPPRILHNINMRSHKKSRAKKMIFRGVFGLFYQKYPKGGPSENFEKNKKIFFFLNPP